MGKNQTQFKRIKEKITVAIKDKIILKTLIQKTNSSIKINYQEIIFDKIKNFNKIDNKVKFLRNKKTIYLE